MVRKTAFIWFLFLIIPFLAWSQKLELLTPSILNLGTVQSDTIATGVIKFSNAGEKTLKIKKVQTSCGCTLAELKKKIYNPGETGELNVQFNTRGYSGVVRKNIIIYLEEGQPSSTRVIVQVRVVPKIEVEPRFIDFQKIRFSESPIRRTFLVRNNMKKPLVVQKLKLNNAYVKVTPEHFKLAPGESQVMDVSYKPHKVGRDDSMITLLIESPSHLQTRIPIFVNVMPKTP